MGLRARHALLSSGDWITVAHLTELMLAASTPASALDEYQRAAAIFSIVDQDVEYYPRYAFDASQGYRPLPVLRQVIAALRPRKGSWGLAWWLMSVNSALGGSRPQDLLVTAPERVAAAAADEAQGVQHA